MEAQINLSIAAANYTLPLLVSRNDSCHVTPFVQSYTPSIQSCEGTRLTSTSGSATSSSHQQYLDEPLRQTETEASYFPYPITKFHPCI